MNKTMMPFLCIIVGSLITVFAAFYDYRQKLEDKQKQLDAEIKRNSEYQTLLNKSESIIHSQQSVIENSKTIIDLQSELEKKKEKLINYKKTPTK